MPYKIKLPNHLGLLSLVHSIHVRTTPEEELVVQWCSSFFTQIINVKCLTFLQPSLRIVSPVHSARTTPEEEEESVCVNVSAAGAISTHLYMKTLQEYCKTLGVPQYGNVYLSWIGFEWNRRICVGTEYSLSVFGTFSNIGAVGVLTRMPVLLEVSKTKTEYSVWEQILFQHCWTLNHGVLYDCIYYTLFNRAAMK